MKICVTNNLGRPYLISYVVKEDKANFTRHLLLNRGVNIVDNKLFEKVKTHWLVKHYIDKKIFVVTSAIESPKNNTSKDNVKHESEHTHESKHTHKA